MPGFCWKLQMRAAFAAAAFFSCVLPSYASLGGAPTNFSNQSRIHAQALAAAGTGAGTYTVNTATLPNGTTVREYVSPAGTVFAVSWRGPFLPDLRALLGQHFETMKRETARHPKAGHSQLLVDDKDVTIESRGHMRAYNGRAWVASLFPAGFSAGEIE